MRQSWYLLILVTKLANKIDKIILCPACAQGRKEHAQQTLMPIGDVMKSTQCGWCGQKKE